MRYYRFVDIAKVFGTSKDLVRFYLKKKGFLFEKKRLEEAGNQVCLVLGEKEFERAKKVRLDDGYKLKA